MITLAVGHLSTERGGALVNYYFDKELPLGDEESATKNHEAARRLEVFVSDFFGTHEIYLRVDGDAEGTIRLGREDAKELVEGLAAAMRYLSY